VVHEVLKGAGKWHRRLRFGVVLLLCAASLQARAARIDINIPTQSAAKALVEFAPSVDNMKSRRLSQFCCAGPV